MLAHFCLPFFELRIILMFSEMNGMQLTTLVSETFRNVAVSKDL